MDENELSTDANDRTVQNVQTPSCILRRVAGGTREPALSLPKGEDLNDWNVLND